MFLVWVHSPHRVLRVGMRPDFFFDFDAPERDPTQESSQKVILAHTRTRPQDNPQDVNCWRLVRNVNGIAISRAATSRRVVHGATKFNHLLHHIAHRP